MLIINEGQTLIHDGEEYPVGAIVTLFVCAECGAVLEQSYDKRKRAYAFTCTDDKKHSGIKLRPSSSALALPDPAVVPIVTVDEARSMWDAYKELERAVLAPDDYMYFVDRKVGDRTRTKFFTEEKDAAVYAAQGGTLRRRKKKSGCRKMLRFFGLRVPQRSEEMANTVIHEGETYVVKVERGEGYVLTVYNNKSLEIVKAEATVVVAAPNGQTMVGTAACAASERGFSHPDHDVVATAFTRALNRATLDLVGWGEVSAEEMVAITGDEEGEVIEGYVEEIVDEPAKPEPPKTAPRTLKPAVQTPKPIAEESSADDMTIEEWSKKVKRKELEAALNSLLPDLKQAGYTTEDSRRQLLVKLFGKPSIFKCTIRETRMLRTFAQTVAGGTDEETALELYRATEEKHGTPDSEIPL